MKNGVLKVVPSHKNYSLHRTFGSIAPEQFTENNFDAGFPVPDQDAQGLPFGCTGYSQSNLAQDEDKTQYVPKYTYDQTLAEEGIFPDSPNFEQVGCSITDSLNSTIVYGLQPVDGTDTPLDHRRGAYYQVEQVDGLDWFDSIRSALQQNQRSISVCTPWYNSFATPFNGVLRAPGTYDTTFASWHDWVCCGWTTIQGVPYLICKSWQGTGYGINGFCYISREIINQLLSVSGTGAFTVAPYVGANVQNVELTILQTVISYLRQILALLQ